MGVLMKRGNMRADLEAFAGEFDRLVRLRGLTQEDLEELAGVPQSSISKYKSGERKPEPDTARKLASALGVPYRHLAVLLGYFDVSAEDQDLRRRVPLAALMEAMARQYPELEPQFAEHMNDDDFAAQVETLARVLGFTAREWLDQPG